MAALLGAGIALVLVPWTPPGIPILVASTAALLGLAYPESPPESEPEPMP